MNEIICNITMFTMKQCVLLRTRDEVACLGYVTTSEMPEKVANWAEHFEANVIHLFGAEQYVTGLAENIKIALANEFSKNEITVEVN